MSYDLYFQPGTGGFSETDFLDYFSQRPHYEIDGHRAWYENEASGVYFSFEYQATPQEDADEDEVHYPLAFNMNYFRPSFFALEAEPELRALVEAFGLRVDDPQVQGMGEGAYVGEKFFSGWNAGNAFAYAAILNQEEVGEVDTLPGEVLRAVWAWNHGKAALQEGVEDDVFVPGIMLLSHQGAVLSACVWPDAIPSVIPPVDVLLIGRKGLAPKGFFGKQEDMVLGAWADFEPLLEAHKKRMQGAAYYLFYDAVPADIVRAVQGLKPDKDMPRLLNADQVLDRELVEAARQTPA